MTIDLIFISGLMFGFEYVETIEEERYVVIDFAFLRLLVSF
jgi:hypothetical protein